MLLSEDEWLAALYPGQVRSLDDYVRFSGLLGPLLKGHVQNILATGTDVVMDFPANTVAQRGWFRRLVSEIGALHEMIYLDTSEDICLRQIARRRREQPERASFDTEHVFHRVTRHFEEPSSDEGLNVRTITRHA